MTSWVGFRHVLYDLRAEEAPVPLVALAERAVADEHRHALWCRDWAVRFGHPGGEVRPRTEDAVALPLATDGDNRLLRIALCAMTETVGCVILRHVRQVVTDPELRRLNRRHLADELQHSRVGWGYLSTLTPGRRAALDLILPSILEALPRACCEGPEEDREELVPYGYFTPRLLRAAYEEALGGIILPGLAHLGFRSAA
jgi:hypothetical protein